MPKRFLIFAGTEKSGSTSLFQYIADSGLACMSRKKETGYFLQPEHCTLEGYLREFRPGEETDDHVYVEATPAYLSGGQDVARRIQTTLPDYLLVFCLRNPLDRLMSYFGFLKSRRMVPKAMDFDTFIGRCFAFEAGAAPSSLGLSKKVLRVLGDGRYAASLDAFMDTCGREQVLVVDFETLVASPRQVLERIFLRLDLDTGFFADYDFLSFNKTFMYRFGFLQGLAIQLNNKFELFWRSHPVLKQGMLKCYLAINGEKLSTPRPSPATLARLAQYYRQDIQNLARQGYITEDIAERWQATLHAHDQAVVHA